MGQRFAATVHTNLGAKCKPGCVHVPSRCTTITGNVKDEKISLTPRAMEKKNHHDHIILIPRSPHSLMALKELIFWVFNPI